MASLVCPTSHWRQQRDSSRQPIRPRPTIGALELPYVHSQRTARSVGIHGATDGDTAVATDPKDRSIASVTDIFHIVQILLALSLLLRFLRLAHRAEMSSRLILECTTAAGLHTRKNINTNMSVTGEGDECIQSHPCRVFLKLTHRSSSALSFRIS
jgi:hypothetical protein